MFTPNKKQKTVKIFDYSDNLSASKNQKASSLNLLKSYNFCSKSGAIKDGLGVTDLSFTVNGENIIPKVPYGREIIRAYFYKKYDDERGEFDNRLLCYCSDKFIYQYKTNGTGNAFEKTSIIFSGVPCGVCYKFNGNDVFIFAQGGILTVFDGETAENYSSPNITSMCVSNERLFATVGGEKSMLWFSSPFNPTKWDVSLSEAGFIDFQDGLGSLNKVIAVNDCVYLIRDIGIMRAVGRYEQQNFQRINEQAKIERIFDSSVTQCGDKIAYLSDSGFVTFDGTTFEYVMTDLSSSLEGVDNSEAHGAYFAGKLYMAVKIKIDKKIEDRIICYDMQSGDYYLVKGINVLQFLPIYQDKSRLIIVVKENVMLGELCKDSVCFKERLNKLWRIDGENFNILSEKTISKLNVKTYSDIEIEIKSRFSKKKLKINGRKTIQHAIVGVKGEEFDIKISSSDSGAYIPQLNFEILYE